MQFVVSSVTHDRSAAHVAHLFMADIFLAFSMCSGIVIDDGSLFECIFITMCNALGITYWCLSRGNYTCNSNAIIDSQVKPRNDRGTRAVYIKNTKTSQNTWNTAPIDNTDICRCMTSVGRSFRFPLELELPPEPLINTESNRSSHQDRPNDDRKAFTLKVGDELKAHVQVQVQFMLRDILLRPMHRLVVDTGNVGYFLSPIKTRAWITEKNNG